jgi:hypothetical protein
MLRVSKAAAMKGLTVQSTLSLNVSLDVEHADLASLERAVSGALAEAGQQLWAELLSALEAAIGRPAACDCGARLKANGRAPRRLVTVAGELIFRRRRWRCTACGAERVPLDAALGLAPRAQHSLGVRERALWLVTELSYAKTADALGELRGWPLSHGQLHRWVTEEGARLERATARGQAELFERGRAPSSSRRPATVWVQADGTMVHDRASGTNLEVRIGLAFSRATTISRGRRLLLDRQLYAGAEGWQTFAERFVAACARLGVFEAERIYFVGDGADWIRWLRERYFPTAVELLDWYHLVEQLRFGVGRAYPELLARALGAAQPGAVQQLLAILESHAARLGMIDPEQAARARQVAGYVRANRRGIANYRHVPLASSAPIEKAVDLAVCRRFKLRGMSWLRAGVTHLLRLRLLRLNGTWQRYWQHRFRAAQLSWPASTA